MEVKAIGKNIRVQPRKVRIVADKVRGGSALRMASVLRFHRSKAAQALRKVIESAIANAENNHGLAPDSLKVAEVYVDGGPRIKRIQARAMGRAYRIEKKSSHITVVVEEAEAELRQKHAGTKAKPRPTFGERKKSKAKPKAEVETPAVEEAPAAEAAAEPEAVAEAEAPAEPETAAESAEPEVVSEPEEAAEPQAADEAATEEIPAEEAKQEKGAE